MAELGARFSKRLDIFEIIEISYQDDYLKDAPYCNSQYIPRLNCQLQSKHKHDKAWTVSNFSADVLYQEVTPSFEGLMPIISKKIITEHEVPVYTLRSRQNGRLYLRRYSKVHFIEWMFKLN